jgi:WbqC-like protein family
VVGDVACADRSMTLILADHQPVYLPWLGLFHKIALADLYCVLDIVQYQVRDFNNRNRIKTVNGPIWLSVPVETKNYRKTMICDIKIIHNGWNYKHARSIQYSYKKAPFFKNYIETIESVLFDDNFKYLTDLNTCMLKFFLNVLNIDTPIVKASDYIFTGAKSDLVLDMCLKLGATDYIFGEQGKNYVNTGKFLKHGVTPYFQKYHHPTYAQINGPFLPYMSIIDLLFNLGPESRKTIMLGNPTSISGLESGVLRVTNQPFQAEP